VAAHPELGWLRLVVEIGALIGLSSVVLVMIIGQPRIFMIMARDGLLPTVFTRIHPKYRTPHINTVITGIGIAVLAAVFPLDVLGELTSMGTLIAFASVCAGVLILRRTQPQLPRPFRIPFAWLICLAGIGSCLLLLSTMTAHNWMLMVIWTVIGFVIYAAYGFRHSRLRGQG
jgi:APA family basic amino acid/polyamine antiporter